MYVCLSTDKRLKGYTPNYKLWLWREQDLAGGGWAAELGTKKGGEVETM